MGKVKLLLDVIGDLRSLADSLQAVADAVADNGAAEAELTTTKEPEKAGRGGKTAAKNTGKKDAKAAKQEPEEKPLTLEEVRAVLAEKSRAGHTAEVKELLNKHGADKLSEMVLPYFWIPEDTLELRVRRDHVPYDVWERQGFLQTTEGNVVHYGYIEKFIERLGERFNIREIAFDRWGAVQMVQNLENMGFTVVPFGQGFKDMSPPTKELMKLVLEQKIAHGGHPVLRWMMDNIFIRTDPAGNIKADKEKSTEKIDGAVATIMGLDRAIRCGNVVTESVYDHRGILFL